MYICRLHAAHSIMVPTKRKIQKNIKKKKLEKIQREKLCATHTLLLYRQFGTQTQTHSGKNKKQQYKENFVDFFFC